MRALNYICLLMMTASVFIIVSCEDIGSKDSENPQILSVRFNMHDTIFLLDDLKAAREQKKYIAMNDSLKDKDIADTIVIGRPLTISGEFSDNESLSSIYVHIWGDTVVENNIDDTCYRIRKVPSVYMSGKMLDTLRKVVLDVGIPDKQSVRRDGKDISLPIRSSNQDKEGYSFTIKCIDLAGNEDSVSYYKKPIYLLTEEEVKAANPR